MAAPIELVSANESDLESRIFEVIEKRLQRREQTGNIMAILLTSTACTIIVGFMAFVIVCACTGVNSDSVFKYLSTVAPFLASLLGTVLGFYFGKKEQRG